MYIVYVHVEVQMVFLCDSKIILALDLGDSIS